MPLTHRVRRGWRNHPAGTLVDAGLFRNGPSLIRAGYIEPLTPGEAAAAPQEPKVTIPNTPPSERRSHVVPVPDEPRAPLGPPPQPEPSTPPVEGPPADQRPATPPPGPPPPKEQRPAKQDVSKEPGPPKGQEPARVPNDETISRDEAEEARRDGRPTPQPGPAPARRRLPE